MANGTLLEKPLGRLEQGKARRRLQIIDAARDIIRETGEAGLSMRTLAARASLSLATPYNLFGSKQAVLLELFSIDGASFDRTFAAQATSNKLSRLFEYLDMSFNLYRSDPQYYRSLLRTLYRTEDAQLRSGMRKSFSSFLKRLLGDALDASYFEPKTSIALVRRQLFGIFLYAVQEWVYGTISLERARLETGFGYSLILLGVVADHAKPELIDRRNRLRNALDQMIAGEKEVVLHLASE